MSRRWDDNRVALKGEWDLGRQAELDELLSRLSVDGEATIDLRGCTYADSTVLAALVAIRAKFAETPMTLLGPNKHLKRLLRIASFDRLFRIKEADG